MAALVAFLPVERLAARRQDVLDAVLGVGAFVLALIELYGPTVDLGHAASRPGVVFLLALQTLPVSARRRAPLAVFIVVGLADLATALPISPALSDLSAASYLTLQLANYTVNAHLPRRIGLGAAAALIVAVLWAMQVRGEGVGEGGWVLLFLIAPTLAVAAAGGYIRERRIAAAALEERARALEAERDESARRAAAVERARIARELHDVVAHSMSVMVVQAGAGRRVVEDDPARAREALSAIEVTGRDALAELRRLLGVLRRDEHEPAALAPQPGLGELPRLIESFREAGLPVELAADAADRQLPPGADLSAYRVVQEALTNALRHANASRVLVTVRSDADGVDLEIVDDGRGPPAPSDGEGTGLIGMRERVAFFGGRFAAGAGEGGGFRVWAHFPLETQ